MQINVLLSLAQFTIDAELSKIAKGVAAAGKAGTSDDADSTSGGKPAIFSLPVHVTNGESNTLVGANFAEAVIGLWHEKVTQMVCFPIVAVVCVVCHTWCRACAVAPTDTATAASPLQSPHTLIIVPLCFEMSSEDLECTGVTASLSHRDVGSMLMFLLPGQSPDAVTSALAKV